MHGVVVSMYANVCRMQRHTSVMCFLEKRCKAKQFVQWVSSVVAVNVAGYYYLRLFKWLQPFGLLHTKVQNQQ